MAIDAGSTLLDEQIAEATTGKVRCVVDVLSQGWRGERTAMLEVYRLLAWKQLLNRNIETLFLRNGNLIIHTVQVCQAKTSIGSASLLASGPCKLLEVTFL